MKTKSFNYEDNGQALSLDLMLGFVIITIIIGISANAMDVASYKMQDYSSGASLGRITADAADILVKSSGSPNDWELYGISSDTVPGLAKRDPQTGEAVPNTISIQKVIKLKENYNNLVYGNILPQGVDSSMMIYPSTDSFAPISIMSKEPPANVCEVAVVNRTVLLDFMHLKTVIYGNTHKGNFSGEECANPDHKSNNSHGKPEWACCHFNITREELYSYDFYIITSGQVSGSARWIIDKANWYNSTENLFAPAPILVNDKLKEILANDSRATLWLHIRTAGTPGNGYDCYIVSVPKGTSSDMVDIKYLDSGPWFFVLQVWY